MQPPSGRNPTKPPIPELIGATGSPVLLQTTPTTVSFAVHAPTGPALLRADGQPKRVMLALENVSATKAAPNFGVYLNLPPGDAPDQRPDLYAMTLSTFGLNEFSEPSKHHPGDGLTFRKEITPLYLRLIAARDWDSRALRVTIVPLHWEGPPIDAQIGRISLMLE